MFIYQQIALTSAKCVVGYDLHQHEVPEKNNFHFRDIRNMRIYPALNSNENTLKRAFKTSLRSIYILADFIIAASKAVCYIHFVFMSILICLYKLKGSSK